MGEEDDHDVLSDSDWEVEFNWLNKEQTDNLSAISVKTSLWFKTILNNSSN